MKNSYGVFKWFWNYSFKTMFPTRPKIVTVIKGIIPCCKFMYLYWSGEFSKDDLQGADDVVQFKSTDVSS